MKLAKPKPTADMQPFWMGSKTIRQHMARCRSLPPPTEADIGRMVETFLTGGGSVTKVSPAFAAPTVLGARLRAPTEQ